MNKGDDNVMRSKGMQEELEIYEIRDETCPSSRVRRDSLYLRSCTDHGGYCDERDWNNPENCIECLIEHMNRKNKT